MAVFWADEPWDPQDTRWRTEWKKPMTLLVGNGPARTLGGKGWGELLASVAGQEWWKIADLTLPEQFAVIEARKAAAAHAIAQVTQQCHSLDAEARKVVRQWQQRDRVAAASDPRKPRGFAELRELVNSTPDLAVCTTNYDHVLEIVLGAEACVHKIHGDARKKNTIVLGQNKYLRTVREFLQNRDRAAKLPNRVCDQSAGGAARAGGSLSRSPARD